MQLIFKLIFFDVQKIKQNGVFELNAGVLWSFKGKMLRLSESLYYIYSANKKAVHSLNSTQKNHKFAYNFNKNADFQANELN